MEQDDGCYSGLVMVGTRKRVLILHPGLFALSQV